ncbi:hypothetical protein MAMC_02227 [Methylacidimicrobium cyclopophantes]|uniref:Uncharacterized protein n=1 Tax=Methylacidimicrobium cyclopophantes TaxID=1041766 RepID=A0A5E6MQP7_9BACT|nr:hypothetical protein MAMC_02227 [Methylacidimicrobium cyclopophantes]
MGIGQGWKKAEEELLAFLGMAATMQMLTGLAPLIAASEDFFVFMARQPEQVLRLQARIERILG